MVGGQQISNLLPAILKFTPHILVSFIFFSNAPLLLVQQQPDEERRAEIEERG